MENTKRDAKIEEFITHFGNRNTEQAESIVTELKFSFPGEPLFYTFSLKALFQELEIVEEKIASLKQGAPDRDRLENRKKYLVDFFERESVAGLNLLGFLNSPKDKYLAGRIYTMRSAFIKKFKDEYLRPDEDAATGIGLIKSAIQEDPKLCSAKYTLAVAKYMMATRTSGLGFKRLIISHFSKTFSQLGGNFDVNDAWNWAKEANSCEPVYYYIKDAKWDSGFLLKQMLWENHEPQKNGHRERDEQIIGILDELCQRFPENKRIQNERLLILRHLEAGVN
ncbi:MAG: hypothetical protein Q8Q06_02940 [bacterium]|nr:hypothetical protein [bacterium]